MKNPILSRLNLRLDPDDRIALLGRNGNGKTTLARLLAAQLKPMDGAINASGKLRVGYFTQYQVEELDPAETPLQHMTRLMKVRHLRRCAVSWAASAFPGPKATTEVGKLSGGERARLALGLITREAPHMLILDEPTNHLDVDAREALIQALNDYTGAVVIVSHDRHMLEMTADRLVLVDGGTAKEFDGSIDDYIAFVLTKDSADARKGKAGSEARPNKKDARKAAAEAREKGQELRNRARHAEAALAKLTATRSAIDQAMFDPGSAQRGIRQADHDRTDEAPRRIIAPIEAAEQAWLEASEAMEAIAA